MRSPTHIGHSMFPSSSAWSRTNSAGPSAAAGSCSIHSLPAVPPR